AIGLGRVPGEHELAAGLEAGGAVEPDGGLVVRAGPDVAEGHAALAEQADGLLHEDLADAVASVLGGDIDLRDLALEAGPGVEEDDPAEADHLTAVVADREDDVLAAEAVRDRRQ